MIFITGFPGQDARILTLACGMLQIQTYVMTHRSDNFTRNLGAYATNLSGGTIKLVQCSDLFEFGLKRFLREKKIRYIFHLAALSDPSDCEKNPIRAYEANVKLTEEILRAAIEVENDVRVAFASSIYVKSTEDCRNSSIEETTRDSSSCGVYVRTKKICSELIGIYRRGGLDKCSQFFLGNHESPIRKDNFIIPTLLKKIRDDDCSQDVRRPYVVRDWQDAFISIAQMVTAMKLVPGKDFVVGSGNSYSIADIANKLAEINNKSLLYEHPYDRNERDIVDINPQAIETITGINGSDDNIWLMLKYLNECWGKVSDSEDIYWMQKSPGWILLRDSLCQLMSEYR